MSAPKGRVWSVLDHGYLRLVGSLGSDEDLIEAARTSTGKGFIGWGPNPCPKCVSPSSGISLGHDGKNTCRKCGGKRSVPGDEALLARMWRKRHTSSFEFGTLIFQVRAPIMVFREWHRHRTQSYNEASARYAPLPALDYIPSMNRLLPKKIGNNKQAARIEGAPELSLKDAAEFRDRLERWQGDGETLYSWALEAGVPKEIARLAMSVGRYSTMRASANLLNWFRFLRLRFDDEAQEEIRVYAEAIGRVVRELFPRTWALFVEETGKDVGDP